ncbi:peptidoglycan-associated lipoprotein Pal [Pseudooceanicola sp. CBS1P-1]|uniref:Peptidoglycan-associated lipoprotein n=1 Tax=Pseudooceanicola albus TaxID=2692189 RepID=A0A6L7FZX5_9RHOB|nr:MULTISPECIES: peptidoglycan-associated lipoprotein Pal [Pseudooceanicola]MBT9382701.1 peptidoglycan-associated lipoprotein Pal [Pseudooceanicola endophyticus]MXN17239.1 peptidoglycan-associated lipoprotein Pal [Pseudooceanicola albus]
MTYLAKAALVFAVLGLAACTNGDRFGKLGGGYGANGANGAYGANGYGANGITSGGLNDPTSPAYFQQTVGDRVHFIVDQSSLNPEARQILDGQIRWLNANPDFNATIEGHADEQGTREYNLALGARRAAAVKDYLVAGGVRPNRLQTISYGKERPIALCSDESCYAQNRRAVTVLRAPGM